MGGDREGRFLAEFELYVMLAVSRLGDEAYGAEIRREIESRAGRPVSIGALYATLGRLGDKGLLEFEISEPEPVPGGRARKYCRLTPEGREALEHSVTRLGRMMQGVELPGGVRLASPVPEEGS
jgi:DNA-binding PadR family transcriptional regulator